MNDYATLYTLLQKRLDSYSSGLHAAPANLYDPIRYFLALGGKRLRPLLALIGCDLFDKNAEAALPAAMAVELFHNFSLVHDDIMDKAPLRRGQATVHEKWNPTIAILSGDALLVKAYEELAQASPEKLPALLKLFNTTAVEVCEGQQLDMDFETSDNIGIDAYLHMITLKTAVLLGCSLKMGALCAHADETTAQHLYDFGKQIGIAFQLKDDILDVYGVAEKFGKQVGGDIISNKKTFLLLSALSKANGAQKKELQHWIGKNQFDPDEKVFAVREIYTQLRIRESSEDEMNAHFEKALTHLELVPAAAEKKELLKKFTIELMQREN